MGFLASEAALGIYAVAVNASEVLLYLPSVTATALLPVAARADALVRTQQALRAFRSVAVVIVAVGVMAALLGPVLLPLLFGAAFEASVGPFLWLLPGLWALRPSRSSRMPSSQARRPGIRPSARSWR